MFNKKKDSEKTLTHDIVACGIPSNPDDVQELIEIVNASITKVPHDIYTIVRGIPEEVITSDSHDSTRKSLLKVMCDMARNNDELASKVTKKIVEIAEKTKV